MPVNPVLLDFPDHFSTERLDVRAPRPGDGPELNAAVLESWPELSEFVPFAVGTPPSVTVSESLMREAAANFVLRKDLWMLVLLKDQPIIVGSTGLTRIDWSVPSFEIGYWARTRYAGKGYMTEAVTALTRFAFERIGARRVHLRCDVRNVKSQRLAERAGFEREGRQRNGARDNTGELCDMFVYSRVQ